MEARTTCYMEKTVTTSDIYTLPKKTGDKKRSDIHATNYTFLVCLVHIGLTQVALSPLTMIFGWPSNSDGILQYYM